jgi:hypothetical protein
LLRAAYAGADPVAVAIAGWHLATHRHPALTAAGRLRIERFCEIADRHGGRPGLGLWLLLGDLQRHTDQIARREIVSLEYFTWRLRRAVRDARTRARHERRRQALEAFWGPSLFIHDTGSTPS